MAPRTSPDTAGPLARYHQKRNFSATPEPHGKRARRGTTLRFVIQKHAASHLHYDFRLELDGTLKSWAVPKGPSLDPHDKRLAMHVEDHPLDYADFEGTIPAGNYGAGTVIVWDNGDWEPVGDPAEGYRKGRLKFQLHGKKLNGLWNLVRGHKDPKAWFLIKHQDDSARPASDFNIVEAMPDSVLGGTLGKVWRSKQAGDKTKLPKRKAHSPNASPQLPTAAKKSALPLTLAPQLATLVDAVPTGAGWIYEVKFDGYRILARIDGDDVRFFTRNGNDWTSKLPHLVPALRKLELDDGWLDGEIVVFNEREQPSFQKLQNAFEANRTGSIEYYLFDLPFANGRDLRSLPLLERRAALEKILDKAPRGIHFSTAFDVPPKKLFEHACEMHLEGLIGKRASGTYHSARSRDWIKLKCLQRQEFVIGGYTDPSGARTGTFGSLLLGIHDPNTGKLRYAGRVGTGFTDITLRELTRKLKSLARETMPFAEFSGEKPSRAMHWVEPKLIGEVSFSEWTADGHLRHPSFQGLRADKPPRSITVEKALPAKAAAKSTTKTPAGKAARSRGQAIAKKAADGVVDTRVAGIPISHADRVVDAHTGATKLDLAHFYEQIAPVLLPHLQDRAVSLVRAPAGIDGPHFFQKHLNGNRIPFVRELDAALFPEHPPLVTIDSVEALVACTQMNVLEFHTWNATVADMQHPDRLVFDLDPGENVQWQQIVEGTELTRALLAEIGLKSFLKTSGGKGLHIVVPIEPRYEWEVAKGFSRALVEHLAAALPSLFVAKSGPKNRVGRIFVDYLRNGLGATTVSAFSTRARPGLGVSVPLPWNMLRKLNGSAQWTIADVDQILAIAKKQPWKGMAALRQELEGPAERLEFELKPARKSKSRR
jgi:bifunctional non-homologous end joining protein LigD